jgi:cyclase
LCKALSLALFAAIALPATSRAEALFDVNPVAEGVYAAIARPHRPENANSAFILLDDGVLVVDTASSPSSARALIAEIRKLTPKPVKWIVNTHFHWDHYWGNEAFVEAFPNVEIISSQRTRQDMERMGLGNPLLARWSVEIPATIADWKRQLAETTDLDRRQRLMERILGWEAALPELKAMRPALPTLTFERRMVLHSGTRTVELLWLGRGHTAGDVVVYLPEQRVMATGDLLAGDTPYIADITPYDWIRTLEALEKFDFGAAIPGHGEVMGGKEKLHLWEEYFRDLMAETERAYAEGASMAETVKRVSATMIPKYSAKMPPTFPQDIVGNIQKAYRVVSGDAN